MTTPTQETERLWSEFADQLGGFLRSRVNSASEADDLRQEVFLKLQKQLETGNSVHDLNAWLYRTARNAIIDRYRTHKPTVEIEESSLISFPPSDPDLAPLMASFRRMIHSLPDGYRDAVLLADIEELPHKEVATHLGLSLSATKSRILRGRQMLRESLDACCQFERDSRGTVIDCEPRASKKCTECS
ncbi:sigma-70 family RNA polymerase sigma factor [Kamptonema cortianum]|nr:sigma-70 family RNA polymerase sigma factor [Kamptonema cortianum]MDL5048627.1 sigma-70 family RNA polymerase sigma factor [Oscillatoria amoena NRMC-F 0135]MDL5053284.1 sigma-70 family RNA polymerase sigma factor [Oscillatoria laete-virens NRMC-F 0139]